MPPVAAIASGIGAVLGGGASVVGAAASMIGSAAVGTVGLGVGAASGLVSGIGSLFAGPAAGPTVGESMAAIAPPAYYETAGSGVLGGITSAVSKTAGYLGEMAPAAAGIYSVIRPSKQQQIAKPSYSPVQAAQARMVDKSPLPIFSQQPKVIPIGSPSAGPAEKKDVNIMLYIGLALLAFILLRKK